MYARRLTAGLLACGAIAVAGCGGDEQAVEDQPEQSVDAFCQQVEEFQAAEDPFQGLAPDDIEGATAGFEQFQSQLDEIREVAPEEIQADVEALQGGVDDIIQELEGIDPNASPQEIQQQASGLQEEVADVQPAVQRLEEFTNENCEQTTGDEGSTGGDTAE